MLVARPKTRGTPKAMAGRILILTYRIAYIPFNLSLCMLHNSTNIYTCTVYHIPCWVPDYSAAFWTPVEDLGLAAPGLLSDCVDVLRGRERL